MKQIKLMKLDERATMPKFAKQGDSGFDMYTLEDTIIKALTFYRQRKRDDRDDR